MSEVEVTVVNAKEPPVWKRRRVQIGAAVALLIDHCFTEVGLHRVEIDIRPENGASLRVVDKLGLRREGFYERYLDIDGAWRDHVAFAEALLS